MHVAKHQGSSVPYLSRLTSWFILAISIQCGLGANYHQVHLYGNLLFKGVCRLVPTLIFSTAQKAFAVVLFIHI